MPEPATGVTAWEATTELRVFAFLLVVATALLAGPSPARADTIDAADCYHRVAMSQFIVKLRYFLPRAHGVLWARPGEDTRPVFTQAAMPFDELQRGAIVSLEIPSRGISVRVGIRISEFSDLNVWIMEQDTHPRVAAVTNLVASPSPLPPDAAVFRVIVPAERARDYPPGFSDLGPLPSVGGLPTELPEPR